MIPRIIIHTGCSLDGRIDWLKSDNYIYYRIMQNWKIDAMLSGSNTILAAEMSTEAEIPKINNQYLIVVDSKGQINHWDVIKRQAYWNDSPIVLVSKSTPKTYLDLLESKKVQFLIHGETHVDLRAALEDLGQNFNIQNIRVDSGGKLIGILLRQNLVDEIHAIIQPQLTGGTSAKTIFVASDLTSFSDVIDLELIDYEIVDNHYIHLHYKVRTKKDIHQY